MQAVDAPQLLERPLVVVDAQVDEDVREARVAAVLLDHEQARGLLAAAVAARGLSGVEAVEQAVRERLPGAALERVRERVDRRFGDEDVALGRVPVARPSACPARSTRPR